jgi:hypothetical protein
LGPKPRDHTCFLRIPESKRRSVRHLLYMTDETLYRYTAGGKGIFMQEDDLTPAELRPAIEAGKSWLPQPHLECDCQFYMTAKGKEMYEMVLKPLHEAYMPPIECEEVQRSQLNEVVYEDEYQVGEKME